MTTQISTIEIQAQAFVAALNARAEVLAVESGRRPLYNNFGFELGRKYARIFWATKSGSRSALAFVDAEGVVRRSDSWKAAGRVLGTVTDGATVAFVGGPA